MTIKGKDLIIFGAGFVAGIVWYLDWKQREVIREKTNSNAVNDGIGGF